MHALLICSMLAFALSACAEMPNGVHYGFEYSTHSAEGDRICSSVCLYRLEELSKVEESLAGVHVYGFLIRRGGNLYVTEASDGSGVSVRIDSVGAEVEGWMLTTMEGYFTSVRGYYDPMTKGLDVFLLRRPNLPGVPRPELPPLEKR